MDTFNNYKLKPCPFFGWEAVKAFIVLTILLYSCGVNNTLTETDWEPICDSTHTLFFDTTEIGHYDLISSSIMSVWQKPMSVNDCNVKINYQDGNITISPKDTSKAFYGDAYAIMFQWLSKRIDSLQQEIQNAALDFCNYCYEHEVLEPTYVDFAKFQQRYGEYGEMPNYYQDRRK